MTTEATSTSAPDADADTGTAKPSAREQSRQLLGRLVETYPKAFFSQSARQVHPLKLGIHKDLQPVIKDWGYEPLALKLALAAYIRQLRYQIAITKEAHRVDLAGEPAGEISAEHRQKALEQVEAIRATRKPKPARPARPGGAAPAGTAPATDETAAVDGTAPAAAAARPPRRGPRPDGERSPRRAPATAAAGEAPAAAAPAREPRRERRPRPDGEAPRRRPERGERPDPRRERAPVRTSAAPPEPAPESAFALLLREALAKQDEPTKD